MPTAHTSERSFHNDTAVIALVQAQDASYAVPLREYLHTHGCIVETSASALTNIRYHIIIGDLEYVKTIGQAVIPNGVQRLVLIWNLTGEIEKRTDIPVFGKIVLVDTHTLTTREVTKIFAYFFTGKEDWLDIRGNIQQTKNHGIQMQSAVTTKPVRMQQPSNRDEDQKRITQFIAAIYTPSKQGSIFNTVYTSWFYHKKTTALLLLAVIIFAVPLTYFVSLFFTGYFLQRTFNLLQAGDYAGSQSAVASARRWHKRADQTLPLVTGPLQVLGLSTFSHNQERVVSFLDKTTASAQSGLLVLEDAKSLGISALAINETTGNAQPAAQLEQIRNEISYLQGMLGLAQAELEGLVTDEVFPFSLNTVKSTAQSAKKFFISARTANSVAADGLSVYPELMGFRDEKKYLILLQNSAELRPTGGFIGSVALISFADGRLKNLAIQDVYALDGQLKGHVSPPLPIQNVLKQEHWYLRDSNWDADFYNAAKQAAWFYEKESGIVVDGVFGVNMPMIQTLLKVTGPIQMPDYNDEITADNFFEKAVYYIHNDFFPGSTQKKDFLGAVATAILARITDPSATNPVDLLKTVDVALTRKNLLVYFTNDAAQSLADRFQWSGRMRMSEGCQTRGTAECISDYVYVVDANFGVNKVNYFVNRDEIHSVAFGPAGDIAATLRVIYTNTARTDSPGGGVYRNYARIYLPADTIVSEIALDGIRVPTNTDGSGIVPYVEPVADAENLSGVAIVFDTPPGSSREISIQYQHARSLPVGNTMQYDLLHQKQPGLFRTTTKTIFTYPPGWNITGERINALVSTLSAEGRQDDFVAKSGQLEYNSNLLQDTYLRLTIRKQEEQ